MAIVTSLEKDDKQVMKKQSEIGGKYKVFYRHGDAYLKVVTFGKEDREAPDTQSQNITFSPNAIAQLREILENIKD